MQPHFCRITRSQTRHQITPINHLSLCLYVCLCLGLSFSVTFCHFFISSSVYLSHSFLSLSISVSFFLSISIQVSIYLSHTNKLSSFRYHLLGKSCLILRKRPFVSSKSLAIDKELESKEEIFIFKEEDGEPRPRRRRCRPIVNFTNIL